MMTTNEILHSTIGLRPPYSVDFMVLSQSSLNVMKRMLLVSMKIFDVFEKTLDELDSASNRVISSIAVS